MPFWSMESRAVKVVQSVAAYDGFELHEIPLADFKSRWLPGLERDGLLVGINWSGDRATGYDMKPSEVSANFTAR